MMKNAFYTTLLGFTMLTSCITINQNPDTEASTAYEEEYLVQEDLEDNYIEELEGEPSFEEEFGLTEESRLHETYLPEHKTNQNFRNERNGREFKTHNFRDARTGLVVNSTQFPSTWTVISKPSYTVDQKIPVFMVQTSGPHNLKSFNTPMRVNISYQNPQTYQFMQQATYAKMHRPMVSNEQLLKEEVLPRMQKTGFTYVGETQLHKSDAFIAKKMQTEGQGILKMDGLHTIWKNQKGQKALVSIGKIYRQQPLGNIDVMTLWMYSVSYTFVDESYFDSTVDAFENALINTKDNPQWNQYIVQLSRLRQQQAMQQHRLHMQNKQAAFDAHQKKMQGIWAAQDANYASFMNKHLGPGSDRLHNKVVNMINEEETVYNPLDGETYQVNAFSDQNWMDGNGNLVQNNDLFYTPNGDINLNNREWVQVGPRN